MYILRYRLQTVSFHCPLKGGSGEGGTGDLGKRSLVSDFKMVIGRCCCCCCCCCFVVVVVGRIPLFGSPFLGGGEVFWLTLTSYGLDDVMDGKIPADSGRRPLNAPKGRKRDGKMGDLSSE